MAAIAIETVAVLREANFIFLIK